MLLRRVRVVPVRYFGAKAKAGGPPAAAAPEEEEPRMKTNFEGMIEEGGVE